MWRRCGWSSAAPGALECALPIGGAGQQGRGAADRSVALIDRGGSACCAGLVLAKRRGEPRDLLTAGLAGGLLGLAVLGAFGSRCCSARSAFWARGRHRSLPFVSSGGQPVRSLRWLSKFVRSTPPGRSAGEPMMARYLAIVLAVLCLAAQAHGQGHGAGR